jgi:eukaryotic-like serine/threonine-protein kinase
MKFNLLGEEFDRNSGLSEYDVVTKLGEGGFGNVSLAQHKLTKEKFAIKFLKGSALGTTLLTRLIL